MRRHLLDASALLALILNERGGDRVEAVLDDSEIHAVNLAEVARKLLQKRVPQEKLEMLLSGLSLHVQEEFTAANAMVAAGVAAANQKIGLALGDAVCLAAASSAGMVAVTAEREWVKIRWPETGSPQPEILVIR